MPVDALGWITGIARVVKDATSIFQTNPAAKKQSLAKSLIQLHRAVADVTSRGLNIVEALSKMGSVEPIDGKTLSFQLFEPPLQQLRFGLAYPSPQELEQVVTLLMEQVEALTSLHELVRKKPFRNLDLLVPEFASAEVTIVNKFGSIYILLSALDDIRTFQQRDVKSAYECLRASDFQRPEDERFSFPKMSGPDNYAVVYSPVELKNAEQRLRQLTETNEQLLSLIKSEFEIEEIL